MDAFYFDFSVFRFVHFDWIWTLFKVWAEVVLLIVICDVIYGNLYWLWTFFISVVWWEKPWEPFK